MGRSRAAADAARRACFVRERDPLGEPGLTLSSAQLNVLERQGSLEEALHLADATRQVDRYVSLLVRLDRLTEARRYGFKLRREAKVRRRQRWYSQTIPSGNRVPVTLATFTL